MHLKSRVIHPNRPSAQRPRGALRLGSALGLILAASLLASLGCRGPGPLPRAAGRGERPSLGERAARILAQAIRIPTVDPPGNERPLAEFWVRVLREAGLEARVIPTPSAGSPLGRAAAWGRLRGAGSAPPIVLLSHLDVVPANRAAWSVDPFAGTVAGGYVIGRGALDAKGVTTVHVLTLLELARRGVRLDRDVIFLATPDEELGGQRGAGYIARHHPELLGGASYLLTEGGGIEVGVGGRADVWGVGVTEKAPCWLRLRARGRPGHASAPHSDQAVLRLLEALDRVRALPRPVEVVPEVQRMFRALAAAVAPEEGSAFRNLAVALARDRLFRERFLAQPHWAALVRDTLAVTVLRAGVRTNVIPGEATAELDARLLPGRSCAALRERVEAAIADPNVTVEELLHFETRASSPDTPLFRALEAVAHEVDPKAVVVPRVSAGFTDAHYFREIGITAYGFVPRWLVPGQGYGVHGPDERISVENLERGIRTMVRILERLARSGSGGGASKRG